MFNKVLIKSFFKRPKTTLTRQINLLSTTLVIGFIFFVTSNVANAAKMGGVYISSHPAGASVQLDEEAKGLTPALVSDLTPGAHVLRISLPGHHTIVTDIEIKPDELLDLRYNLEPLYGSLIIDTKPRGANIYLNGKFIGQSPKKIDKVLTVEHGIKIHQKGYLPWEDKVKPEPDKSKQVRVELKKIPPQTIDHAKDHTKEQGECLTECHDVTQSGAKLTINTNPPGATVYLNGKPKGESPVTILTFPGNYNLHVQKNDYIPQTKDLTLDFKQELTLDFTLEYNHTWGNMVYVPAGEFIMGSSEGNEDNRPKHKVYLDAFYIDKYEVTNAQYKEFILETGHRQPSYQFNRQWGDDNQPVIGVSWDDANAYAQWAGKRLPSEAEWEKAAKGTEQQLYPWGTQWLSSAANTSECGNKVTTKVGSYTQGISPFGAYDMIGNVAEWCNDWYSANYYQQSPGKNPKGPKQGRAKVIRGSSWQDEGKSQNVTTRHHLVPQVRLNTVGFRCVINAPY